MGETAPHYLAPRRWPGPPAGGPWLGRPVLTGWGEETAGRLALGVPGLQPDSRWECLLWINRPPQHTAGIPRGCAAHALGRGGWGAAPCAVMGYAHVTAALLPGGGSCPVQHWMLPFARPVRSERKGLAAILALSWREKLWIGMKALGSQAQGCWRATEVT